MRLKVLICLLLLQVLSVVRATAEKRDSIRAVQISDQLSYEQAAGMLVPMKFDFFDQNVMQFYFQTDLYLNRSMDSLPFVVIEIKKRSVQQFRLRPVYLRKIILPATNPSKILDSIPFTEGEISSGNYELIVTLMNDSNQVIDVKKAGFQLLRSQKITLKDEYYEEESNRQNHIVDIGKTFVANYPIEQLKRNINALSPLAKGVEIKVVREISESNDLDFMKQFFYNFWYNRNASDPEKAWKEYAEKLNYVAKKYGTASLSGFETDRGRIYLQYGVPDKEERVINEKDVLPYEIWFYNRVNDKGNVKFLFYQPGLVGTQMYLLHSTEENEIIDPYWKYKLFLNMENSDNKLIHRVFEYFK
ncbi:MAG: GWxTD domain-containing protein [Chitinophagaceae bacterium]|nr:GWxTD domain-containing protein [Chitinophagaceae bacterium]